jgi:hypothetical protein
MSKWTIQMANIDLITFDIFGTDLNWFDGMREAVANKGAQTVRAHQLHGVDATAPCGVGGRGGKRWQ